MTTNATRKCGHKPTDGIHLNVRSMYEAEQTTTIILRKDPFKPRPPQEMINYKPDPEAHKIRFRTKAEKKYPWTRVFTWTYWIEREKFIMHGYIRNCTSQIKSITNEYDDIVTNMINIISKQLNVSGMSYMTPLKDTACSSHDDTETKDSEIEYLDTKQCHVCQMISFYSNGVEYRQKNWILRCYPLEKYGPCGRKYKFELTWNETPEIPKEVKQLICKVSLEVNDKYIWGSEEGYGLDDALIVFERDNNVFTSARTMYVCDWIGLYICLNVHIFEIVTYEDLSVEH